MAHAIAVAAGKLAEAGAVINIARPAVSLAECYEIYAILNAAQFTAELPEQIRRRLAARADDTTPDEISHPALQTRGVVLSFRDWLMLTARRQAMKRAWEAFFADYDAILLPPAPVGAVPHPVTDDLTKRTLVRRRRGAAVARLPAVVVARQPRPPAGGGGAGGTRPRRPAARRADRVRRGP